MKFREPTGDECNVNAPIVADDGTQGRAMWYPQMGGYVGRAIAYSDDGCVNVFVWHDGEFPFSGESLHEGEQPRSPVHLHHCEPDQFIEFGQRLSRLFPEG